LLLIVSKLNIFFIFINFIFQFIYSINYKDVKDIIINRKDILVKQGVDENKTEHEIMLEREIYKIYDSGSIKFEYLKN